jgi:hypothetical protein
MIQSTNPKFVCIQEMKLQVVNPQIATEFLGHRYNAFQYLPVNGTRGGIMLGWHSDFIITSDLLLKRYSLSLMIRPA